MLTLIERYRQMDMDILSKMILRQQGQIRDLQRDVETMVGVLRVRVAAQVATDAASKEGGK